MLLREVYSGDDIDLLCLKIYGFTEGSVEAVLRENPEAMDFIDNFGRVTPMDRPLLLRFPEVRKPQEVTRITRLFD